MSKRGAKPHTKIPVLNDVIELTDGAYLPTAPMLDEAMAPHAEEDAHTIPVPAPTGIDESAIVSRVLENLHHHIDAMIERRVQAALEPIWRRLTEDIAVEVTTALTLTLSETLRDAVKAQIDNATARQGDPDAIRSVSA